MATDLLEQIFPHIKNSVYPIRETLLDWKMKEGDISDAHSVKLNDKSWPLIRVPFIWGKYDKTFWFRQTIKITEKFAEKPIVLLLDFPEALLYLNGKPFHGIDVNHNEILITEKAKLDEQFVIAVQAYSGRKHEHNTFATAEIAVLDPIARRLESSLNVLIELDKLSNHGSQESKEIKDLIRRTLVFLKYFKPGSEEYPNAIRRAYNFLLNTLETECKTTLPGIVHLIGHSHIDFSWLWTIKETIRKCGRTFSTVLRLMEEFPEFKFSQSQPALYELTKQNYPEIYKQIKQKIVEGRWEPLGAMWVEADCNIPNGESLVRQIIYGKKFIKNEFGIDTDILWLPDTFGFNAAMPQILKKAGIKYFYTSKLLWNTVTQFPYTSFNWQGIDKSNILAHISPVGLEGQVTPEYILKNSENLVEEQTPKNVLQTFGYGDGGGGPVKIDLENALILKTIIGLPTSIISTVKDFFSQVESQSTELPVWDNELYLENHRGTFTTNGWIKKENREFEKLLYNAELLSSISLIFGKSSTARKYPQKELEQTWKLILQNQFHDIISGTAIADVYLEAQNRYNEAKKLINVILNEKIKTILQPVKKTKNEFHFCLFNTQGWQRNQYVELCIKTNGKNFLIKDTDGRIFEHQIIERSKNCQKIIVYIENIPPFGFKNIVVRVLESPSQHIEQWKTTSHSLETPYYRVRIDNKGAFSSIYAKHLRKELIQSGRKGNQILTFKDTPKQWEAWNIEPEAEKHRIEIWNIKQIKIVETGPLRATIRVEYKSDNGSILNQSIHLYHKSPVIDFNTLVRWQEKQVLMKVAFPLNIKSSNAVYDIQYGSINRSTKPRTEWEKAKFEVPAQQWADLSDSKYGVSLLNDCKYGYDAKENVLRLTLLRSAHYPNPIDPIVASDQLIDKGEHTFNYSLYPHLYDWTKSETIRRARELNNPVLVFPDINVNEIKSLVEVSKANILIDSIKKAEDSESLIIRMHESLGTTVDSTLTFGFNVVTVAECDLLENEEKIYKIKKSKLTLKFRPFEIKTIKLISTQTKKK